MAKTHTPKKAAAIAAVKEAQAHFDKHAFTAPEKIPAEHHKKAAELFSKAASAYDAVADEHHRDEGRALTPRGQIVQRQDAIQLAKNLRQRAADHESKAGGAGGGKASKLKAFAGEKLKEHASAGPLMKGKKGGSYRLSAGGRKIYTKK
jgi:hypothetical protein